MTSGRTPKGVKPRYFADAATDKLLQMTITLAGEVSVLRDRIDLWERLAEKKGWTSRDAIEAIALDQRDREERQAARAAFVARVLRVLDQDLEEISNPDARSFEDLVAELGKTQ